VRRAREQEVLIMADTVHGVWWHVAPDGNRVRVQHGPSAFGTNDPPSAIVLVSLPAALELAVGIVHACLDIDSEATQARMLELWVREQ
jgi:hypothetical protein